MSQRTYYDPLHQGITLDEDIPEESLIMKLIDSPPFQRLRRIRQLGPAFLTFHGAESSRFTHSIGVFHIARKALKKLKKANPDLLKFNYLLYASTLLHDLGHGPLSHTSEIFLGVRHEHWSSRIITEHPSINGPLESFQKGSSAQIANLINGNFNENKAIKALVSSQLDCDRLDYLLRDSYSTGTKYGFLDLERILGALTIAPDGDLAIHPKGLSAVEHYLVTRNLMYKTVYNHRLNEVSNWLLEKIFSLARNIGPEKIWHDKHMYKWLWDKDKISLESFLSIDDISLNYHLFRWAEDNQEHLSNLCKRYINRDLHKAIEIQDLTTEKQLKALFIARKLSLKNGLNPDMNCGLKKQKLHGYYAYKGGLRLWDGNKLKALEDSSELILSLTRPAESTLLIHEKNIHDDLEKELLNLRYQ